MFVTNGQGGGQRPPPAEKVTKKRKPKIPKVIKKMKN